MTKMSKRTWKLYITTFDDSITYYYGEAPEFDEKFAKDMYTLEEYAKTVDPKAYQDTDGEAFYIRVSTPDIAWKVVLDGSAKLFPIEEICEAVKDSRREEQRAN